MKRRGAFSIKENVLSDTLTTLNEQILVRRTDRMYFTGRRRGKSARAGSRGVFRGTGGKVDTY